MEKNRPNKFKVGKRQVFLKQKEKLKMWNEKTHGPRHYIYSNQAAHSTRGRRPRVTTWVATRPKDTNPPWAYKYKRQIDIHNWH